MVKSNLGNLPYDDSWYKSSHQSKYQYRTKISKEVLLQNKVG